MDYLEEMVLWNLCARYPNKLFFCPQYDLGGGWSCPDFVVLYPEEKQVWVVEVTGAANATKLANKVRNRELHWFKPLRDHLSATAPITVGWQVVLKIFIRRDAEKGFMRTLGPAPRDFDLILLEDIGFAWEAWGKKLKTQYEKLSD